MSENTKLSSPEVMRAYAKDSLIRTGRVLGAFVAGALVALPVATEQAAENTEISSTIVGVPTEISLRPSSELELEITNTKKIYFPLSERGMSVNARISGLPDLDGVSDVQQFFSPQGLGVLTSLSTNTDAALKGYESQLRDAYLHKFIKYELIGGAGLGLLILGAGNRRRNAPIDPSGSPYGVGHKIMVGTGALALAVGASSGIATLKYDQWQSSQIEARNKYPISGLEGTKLDGAYVNDPSLASVINQGVPYAMHLLNRRDNRSEKFNFDLTKSFEAKLSALPKIKSSERAVLVVGDMHASRPMIDFMENFVKEFEKINGEGSLTLIDVGDQGTGTVLDHDALLRYGAINPNGESGYVYGNHTLEPNQRALSKTKMTALNGFVQLGDISVYGANDVQQTPFLGRPFYPDPSRTENTLGQETADALKDKKVDVVDLHQPDAVVSFIGVDDIQSFYDKAAVSPDEVDDIPASLVVSGHTHDYASRKVYNQDGTWTYVLTVGSAGGANEAPTLNNWSDPGAPPVRKASFSVVVMDSTTGLVKSEYQMVVSPSGDFDAVRHFVGNPEALTMEDDGSSEQRQSSLRCNNPLAKPPICE